MANLETKFVFDNRRQQVVRRWLGLRCPADREHPYYRVSSVYYDTPSWDSLGEKANSEFLKTKIRVRWYDDAETAQLEVKRKQGRVRDKRRLPIERSASGADVAARLQADGVDAPSLLVPAFRIDYTRSRFRHPATGAELCVDHDIRVPWVNRAMVPRHDTRPLATAVLELKGERAELTRDLCFLTRLGCRKQSFSKYLACHRRITGMIG